jgi:uncharacterized protein (DUF362 family)
MSGAAMAEVYIIKTKDREEGVRLLCEATGIEVSGKDVVVKANYNSADPFPASTHKETLRSVVMELKSRKPSSVALLERSGMGSTRKVLEKCGVYEELDQLGAEIMVLDDLSFGQWRHIPGDGTHWRQGFWLPERLLRAGAVVQTCCLKTHRFGGHFTLSLKNSVGLVAKIVPGIPHNFMNELHASPHQRLMIAEINRAYPVDLVVMDAIEGFVRGGPEEGDRVAPGLLLAGRDRVAIDAAGVALLREFGTTPDVAGGKIFGLEQIARAGELGIGVENPGEVEIIPLNVESHLHAERLAGILEREG